jgi:hypothetical protein
LNTSQIQLAETLLVVNGWTLLMSAIYRVIRNDCQGFNNLPYTIRLGKEYVVALMNQEIPNVFFYGVWCAVVMHY